MSTQINFPKIDILGVEVDLATIDQAARHVSSLPAKTAGALYIVKPYVEFFDSTLEQPGFRQQLNHAYMCLPDGVALKWAAHFQQHTKHRFWDIITTGPASIFKPAIIQSVIKEQFGGSVFTWRLLEQCARKNVSVFLVGSPKKTSIGTTAKFIASKLPNLRIVGTQTGRDPGSGVFSNRLQSELLTTLKELRPDIVFIGLNFQTYVPLIAALSRQLDHGVLIGEGGTFDYNVFGGSKPKAPRIVRRAGLEWLWRLILEPSRIKRQLAVPRFTWRVYRSYHSK